MRPAQTQGTHRQSFGRGDRITSLPTLRINTSSVSNWNSFGRRTAWLRLVMKTLAVRGMAETSHAIMPYTNRIWRRVRNTCLYLGFRADLADREEARPRKFFVFNNQQWSESHPLRQTDTFESVFYWRLRQSCTCFVPDRSYVDRFSTRVGIFGCFAAHRPSVWPPSKPVKHDLVAFGGYPGAERRAHIDRVDFPIYKITGLVSEISLDNVVVEIDCSRLVDANKSDGSLASMNPAGTSGGPAYRVTMTPAPCLELIGFVNELLSGRPLYSAKTC